jgi:hypothetical protein
MQVSWGFNKKTAAQIFFAKGVRSMRQDPRCKDVKRWSWIVGGGSGGGSFGVFNMNPSSGTHSISVIVPSDIQQLLLKNEASLN